MKKSNKTRIRFAQLAMSALAIIAMLGASSSHALARQAQFIPLGDLPGGQFYSESRGVSPDGSVVVGQSSGTSGTEAFRWTAAGGMVGLGDLPGGAFASWALGISADESVVVGVSDAASGSEALCWTAVGGMVGLGDLPGGIFSSGALDASADGSVVVGGGNSASGWEAFRWTAAGGMVGLGDLPGGSFASQANGVSADGSAIVGGGHSASGGEAFRWTAAGGMVGLGDLPGGIFQSGACDASADASVVVGSGRSASGSEAFRWTAAGGMVGLGDLLGGSFHSSACGVSADGSAIVGFSQSALGSEAFLWTPALGMVRLHDHLVSLGATGLSGWVLTRATAISADGNAMVGAGMNPSGHGEGWLAFLTPPDFNQIGSSYCGPANVNSTGQSAVISAFGSDLVADNNVRLDAALMPPNQFGYFLNSMTQGFRPNPGASQGNLCLGGSIGRYNRPGEILNSGAGGTFSLILDLTDTPQPTGSVSIMAGETWNFQAWFRDNNPGPTSNFTDEVSITFL